MKAKDLLKWFIDESAMDRLDCTGIDRIVYDDDFDFELFFNAVPKENIPFGDYLYIWEDCIGDISLSHLRWMEDEIYEMEDNDGTKIYLVRIED